MVVAVAYPAAVGAWELIVATAAAIGIGVGAHELSKAKSKAQTDLQTDAATDTCKQCKKDPCKALENGVPGSKYRGGAHRSTKLPSGDGKESHHMPAKASSPLSEGEGPAIQMDPADHANTLSHGRSDEAKEHRDIQRQLIAGGQFMKAQAIDIADIRSQYGAKYDEAIKQMLAYTGCLKLEKRIQ